MFNYADKSISDQNPSPLFFINVIPKSPVMCFLVGLGGHQAFFLISQYGMVLLNLNH